MQKKTDSIIGIFEPIPQESIPALTKTEQQVLRYAAGYVATKLSRHYGKSKSNLAKVYHEILLSWKITPCETSINFLSFTRKLLELANRGGLFEVGDKVFIFFRRMEIIINPIFWIIFYYINCSVNML